ncbi:MAG: hypothetical protein A2Y45_09995 [Tenericutes bacterium GWC2_34_14]|nr:MAG: hypothetical protein A2Z84_00160 [Tenericutes bacterium GWA2_35_7]OHE28907.1 MAG: hypothetical protein A2Y45_09995 [Tenericutes bacterium GWC2_34_14]OHE33882.1 MAG: hypothetical protein A2012_07215 [Tenericutes bacterium GWE2_34_108]OHE36617.1 MAG: hypothetical protein A2Y46_04025 [Tenericutes bacterium GWF1_35_14]OHE37807.1 MAG: hypothetical protein A2Y44_05255 [Tenericutes bacterium GWF2_35_184]OHE42339.1 MAG: hypothetical protein A3K26_03265 [Tenericutes bacterium RIFOXYA12_FULL_35_
MMTFFQTIDLTDMTVGKVLLILGVATLLGGVVSLLYAFTHRKTVYDHAFNTTLLLLPLVVSIIIMLVSNNIARAFSLAGVFTLVRFRSAITDTRDITYILSAVGIGLAMSLGMITYALMITGFIAAVLVVINLLKLDVQRKTHAKLKIIIPENLNYANVFDDVFSKYVESSHLSKVKTTDFGTMFELTYLIKLKANIDQKSMIDELRVRNGNLSITLTTDYISLISE